MKQLVEEWRERRGGFASVAERHGAGPVCEIDLAAIGHNLDSIRSRLQPGTRVIAVLKADAYGHGAAEVGPYLERRGVDAVAVATVGEGVELREQGMSVPIVVLIPILSDEIEDAVAYDLTVPIASVDDARAVDNISARIGRRAQAHIMVDTGLSRGGFNPAELLAALPRLRLLDDIEITGMWGHFASVRSLDSVRRVVETFRTLVEHARRFFPLPCVHRASSGAAMTVPESHFSHIRPGLALYGYLPGGLEAHDLRPAMRITAPVVCVKRYPAGTPVSYEGTYVLTVPSRIATIRFGYADGCDFGLGNAGEVTIEGRRYPIVGRVTMDQLLVDVGEDAVRPGQRAVLLGPPGPSPIELALRARTIPYALLISGGRRVRRVYAA